MDTTAILLVICVVLIAITLILMIGFCCMLRVYLRRQAAANKYRPSYKLDTVYTNGAHENLAFTQERKNRTELEIQNEKETKKKDGNKNEVIKT